MAFPFRHAFLDARVNLFKDPRDANQNVGRLRADSDLSYPTIPRNKPPCPDTGTCHRLALENVRKRRTERAVSFYELQVAGRIDQIETD